MIHLITEEATDIDRAQLVSQRFPELDDTDTHPGLVALLVLALALASGPLVDALGVSESSVKRWVDGGDLVAQRTAGGHRRIARGEALRFARTRCVMPATCDKLLTHIGRPVATAFAGQLTWSAVCTGSKVAETCILFPKIEAPTETPSA